MDGKEIVFKILFSSMHIQRSKEKRQKDSKSFEKQYFYEKHVKWWKNKKENNLSESENKSPPPSRKY